MPLIPITAVTLVRFQSVLTLAGFSVHPESIAGVDDDTLARLYQVFAAGGDLSAADAFPRGPIPLATPWADVFDVAPDVPLVSWWKVSLGRMTSRGVRPYDVVPWTAPTHGHVGVSWIAGAELRVSGSPFIILPGASAADSLERARRIVAVIESV